ncbi:hypothetical protein PAPYR_1941 [Paratrimastix pyriformis]|uniref:Uncharacterized protein n=1 Tax=Paratrimastix pyriformis TaxID=342808 RepID=A0ABQ8UW55_9EUKA|nr:hypothetical protein PAPYR_1941 [Paratrimastix pyriformis]
MNGFGASRYPDMGGDFYDRQRVEAPSEEEQARIRAVQQHVAEQMWPEFLGGEKYLAFKMQEQPQFQRFFGALGSDALRGLFLYLNGIGYQITAYSAVCDQMRALRTRSTRPSQGPQPRIAKAPARQMPQVQINPLFRNSQRRYLPRTKSFPLRQMSDNECGHSANVLKH